MLWQKLSLSSLLDTRGSAVIEFVVVLVPTSLLCLPLVGLTTVYHQSIVDQQQVYEIARFASLADSSPYVAELFRSSKDADATLRYLKEQQGCVVSVTQRTSHQIPLWPGVTEIYSEARVKCERE
jgi:hypothetical protein